MPVPSEGEFPEKRGYTPYFNSGISIWYIRSPSEIPEFDVSYTRISCKTYQNYTRIPQEIEVFPLERRILVEIWYINHQILVCDHLNSGIALHQLIYQNNIPDFKKGISPYFSGESEVYERECI